jgi:F-type H+-transporting ATPase subunit b
VVQSNGALHVAATNPVVPDATELIVGAIAFIIVLVALGKVLMPRMQKMLAERTDAIEGGIQRAEAAEARANQLRDEYERQRQQVLQEAASVRQEAQEQGARIIEELRSEANRQRESIVAAGHAQIAADIQSAQSTLRQDVGKIALELASRIIGESVEDQARQSRIVDRFLDELENRAEAAERVR